MSSNKPPKKKVVVTTQKKSAAPAPKRGKAAAPARSKGKDKRQEAANLIFQKQNYYLMIGGVVLIALGMLLMTGGGMPDPNTWDENIIYGTRRTVLAPLVIIAGLVLEIFGIFHKPSES